MTCSTSRASLIKQKLVLIQSNDKCQKRLNPFLMTALCTNPVETRFYINPRLVRCGVLWEWLCVVWVEAATGVQQDRVIVRVSRSHCSMNSLSHSEFAPTRPPTTPFFLSFFHLFFLVFSLVVYLLNIHLYKSLFIKEINPINPNFSFFISTKNIVQIHVTCLKTIEIDLCFHYNKACIGMGIL